MVVETIGTSKGCPFVLKLYGFMLFFHLALEHDLIKGFVRLELRIQC
jgi:hypothetical protein